MKKFILTLASVLAFNSQAAVISVDLADTEIAVGETTTVNILGEFDSQTEAFDLAAFTVFLNNNELLVDESSFASGLPADNVGTTQILDFYNYPDFGETSMFWNDFTASFSSSGIVSLFSFDVTATSIGDYTINLFDSFDPLYLYFSDVINGEITSITTTGATLSVVATTPADVAAPQTALLLSLAMGGLLLARRRA